MSQLIKHDIFISYSVKDLEVAESIRIYLEGQGKRCFMDKTGLVPGLKYPVQLRNAIKESRVFVLIFSSNSDNSDSVQSEVAIAKNYKVPIIPLRIEDTLPSELEFFIVTAQWLDAFTSPLEKHFPRLLQAVKHLLNEAVEAQPPEPLKEEIQKPDKIKQQWIKDDKWHDIEYKDLALWIQKRIKELNSGKEIRGKTFKYRRNRYTQKYQRKLK